MSQPRSSGSLIIDLVPHMDAGDRDAWPGDQDTRPLTEFGERQARAQCDALAAEPLDALYAGPALRCRQTLQPLAERLGLEITVLPEIGEVAAWRAPAGWEAEGNRRANAAAHGAGSALAGVTRMRALHPEGRVVACSHGHVIPALVSFLIAAHGLAGVPELGRRGQWYRLGFEGERIEIELREVEGFPQE
ncbi:MAG: histidine phosphatase family protein [Dehalococcoidia bacterium]